MSKPRVSVIISGKDAGATIGDSLRSLTLQGFSRTDLQVIAVNDGSVDSTAQVLDDYSAHLTLDIITHETPSGVSQSRNEALEAAEGSYITYLDADDWYAPTHLSSLVDAMDGLKVDFVKTDYLKVEGIRRTLERSPCAVRNVALAPQDYILPPEIPTMIDYPSCWTGMYTAQMKERGLLWFDPALRTAEDRPWTWKQHLECSSFAAINDAGMCYRRGSKNSLTSIYDERQLDFIPAFRTIFAYLESAPEFAGYSAKAVRNFLGILYYHQMRHRSSEMTPEVKEKLVAGSATNVRMIDPDILSSVLTRFGDDRVKVIKPVLEMAERNS